MTNSLIFTVRGTPRPQPRPRRVPGGRFVSTMDPKAKLWRLAIGRTLADLLDGRPRPIFAGPVAVHMTFTGANVASDVDNLVKSVADLMENCGVYANDRQIVRLTAYKRPGSPPGVIVEVEAIEAPDAPLTPLSERPGWL